MLGKSPVLGKLQVLRRPTNLDNSRVRAYCACSRCGSGVVWIWLVGWLLGLGLTAL